VLDVELERRPARHGAVDVAVVDAQVLGHRHRVVDHHLVAATGADVGVDVGLLHAAVGQRPLHRERVVLDAVEVGGDGIVAQPDPGDHRRPVAHVLSSSCPTRSKASGGDPRVGVLELSYVSLAAALTISV
jgi:hypothetical protein